MALGDGTGWDETLPADTTVASNIDDYNREAINRRRIYGRELGAKYNAR